MRRRFRSRLPWRAAALCILLAGTLLLCGLPGAQATSSTGTIAVDLNVANYPFRGVGWNVNPVNFQYGDWNLIRANLDSMQMQYVRVILHPETWHPTQADFITTSPSMVATTQFLQYCQDNNITVWLQNWWTGGKYDSAAPPWPNHYFWLANCCFQNPTNKNGSKYPWAVDSDGNGSLDQGPETDKPYSADQFGQIVTKVVDYWVHTKGFTCIKNLGIWNEPNGKWAYNPRNVTYNGNLYLSGMNPLYNKVWNYLSLRGLLGQVSQVGCDITAEGAADPMTDVGTTLASWDGGQQVDNYLGAVSFHSYEPNYSGLCASVKNQIYANNPDGAYEPILVGEIGDWIRYNLNTPQGKAEHAMDCARKTIGYVKQGAYTVLRWWYNGTDEWGAVDSAGQSVISPQHFNPVKLFANTLPKVGYDFYTMQTTVQGSSPWSGAYFDAVSFSFWDPVSGRNKTAIWLVNDSVYESRGIRVSFTGLTGSKTFRKKLVVTQNNFNYACTIDDYGSGFTASPTTPYFDDALWGKCVQVYVEE
jgi:hypothetical protein